MIGSGCMGDAFGGAHSFSVLSQFMALVACGVALVLIYRFAKRLVGARGHPQLCKTKIAERVWSQAFFTRRRYGEPGRSAK
jgi:hypothetical protein